MGNQFVRKYSAFPDSPDVEFNMKEVTTGHSFKPFSPIKREGFIQIFQVVFYHLLGWYRILF